MKQLSGLDSLFLHSEMHGMPMHMSMLSIYDPSSTKSGMEFKNIVDLFESRINGDLALLRCKLMEVPLNMDQPYWVEDPYFDFVYHIRHIALPKPCNWQKLCSLVANLHAQPLNRNRPLWEVHVIDGLNCIEGMPNGCFAVLFKVHHALMDGKTAMEVFNSLHHVLDDESNRFHAVDIDFARFVAYESDVHFPKILANAALNNVYKSGNLIRMAGRIFGLYNAVMRGIESRELKQLHKNKTRFNGPLSPRRVVDRVNIPFAVIRKIKNKVGDVTVSDIALTVIGGGLRRYLMAKDEMPEDSLVAAVPLSIRKSEEESTIVGNEKISLANVALRTDIKDPLERLNKVHKESQAGKAYAKVLGNNLVADTMNCLYTGLVAWGVKTAVESGVLDKFPPANNTIIANLAGSAEPLYFCGAKMIDSFGMGPLIPNTGLFHTLSSTWESLTIGFTADRQKMEDPAFYAQCLQESFNDLCAKVFQAEEVVEQEVVLEKKKIKKARKKI
ncbi:MAG: wax ester/triacylglycerol synthase family O-acyltransferase [Pseudomonadales bacterium]